MEEKETPSPCCVPSKEAHPISVLDVTSMLGFGEIAFLGVAGACMFLGMSAGPTPPSPITPATRLVHGHHAALQLRQTHGLFCLPPQANRGFSLLMGVHPPWNVPAHAPPPRIRGGSLQPPARWLALISGSPLNRGSIHVPPTSLIAPAQCQARNGSSRASPRPSRLHGRRLPRRAKRPNRSVRTRIIDHNRHWNHPPTFIKPPCLINFINYRPFLFLPTHRIQISLPLRPGRREDA